MNILTSLILVTVLIFILAFAFMHMWNYAVVQAVSIAQPISYWVAMVLMFFVSLFIVSNNRSK